MKKKLAAFLAMMMALVTMSSAAMAEEETPTITAHKANAITIDGDLSDWDLSSPAVLEDASQIIRDLSFWQGPNDLSAKVYAAYDEENLYLAFDVTEDTPYGAIEMLPLDGEDNLKVFISTDPTDDPNRTEYHTNDFLLFLICDNNYFDTAFDRTMVAKEYRQRFISKGIDGGEDVLTEGYERVTQATSTGFIQDCVGEFREQQDCGLSAEVRRRGEVQRGGHRHFLSLPRHRVHPADGLDGYA